MNVLIGKSLFLNDFNSFDTKEYKYIFPKKDCYYCVNEKTIQILDEDLNLVSNHLIENPIESNTFHYCSKFNKLYIYSESNLYFLQPNHFRFLPYSKIETSKQKKDFVGNMHYCTFKDKMILCDKKENTVSYIKYGRTEETISNSIISPENIFIHGNQIYVFGQLDKILYNIDTQGKILKTININTDGIIKKSFYSNGIFYYYSRGELYLHNLNSTVPVSKIKINFMPKSIFKHNNQIFIYG